MVIPKARIAPSRPRQLRPHGDSGGAWLPTKVQVRGTREPPTPMTARANAPQRHRSGANRLSVGAPGRWPGLPHNAASLPVAMSAPRGRDRNRVGSRAARRVGSDASPRHSFSFPDRQQWECGHRRRVIRGLEHRLPRGAAGGRYCTRCASSRGVLFLAQCPFNVFVLKTFLEFGGAVSEEFDQGNSNRLRFVVEPPRLNQSRQFFGNLFRQIDVYGFHSNSISRSALPYCTSGAGHFSRLILGARESFMGGGSRRAADFA